ncbi:hypothetical protein GGR02_001138 [Anoxybacillus voinovskiensis]|uniref:Putative Flp pilus-assembly TadG-like N-terminal domain-containing protein n=1 Tax=Anoxybacteroides voinovskiense TaxID=230470 RepID=A0A840DWA9_9BACL|nr:TadE/TadG family type IV pilus assembly protein [Anoxybacillus voinovskiensis]MBB4073376.1 hypothetical protein [Anoxybacillus voinovskiensis]GGJ61758.1 hypothetical protein GCM10008982_08530 [Anoxybacillus voinovskiensis]
MRKKFWRQEEGNALLLMAVAFFSLLVMAGFVIDGGMIYMTKSRLQKAANAAVLSGAQELTTSEAAVQAVVHDILVRHEEEKNLKQIDIVLEQKVAVDLERAVPLAFGKLLGMETVRVTAHAAAGLRVMGRAKGAAPLGIDESIPLEFYKEYQLKVDSSGVEYGNFGVLALGDPGAQTYEENLRYGYQEEIRVGDILETQTGNIAGKTRSVIQEKINECPDSPDNIYKRDCPRILLIPVYRPYEHTVNQLKKVEVTGFAYFYITAPMNPKDTTITGMFIKRTGTGLEERNSVNRGAFSIRLIE